MLKFWPLIAAFFCFTVNNAQAQTYGLTAFYASEESADAPAGAEAEFVVVPLDDSEMPFMYEWYVFNNEDSSVEYHGFDDPFLGMTPIDARDVTVYVNCYDMMMSPLGASNTVTFKWLKASAAHAVSVSNVSYSSSINFDIKVVDSKDRIIEGQYKHLTGGTSKWLSSNVEIAPEGGGARIGGIYGKTLSSVPSAVNSAINNSAVPAGTLIDTIRLDYDLEVWNWLTETWQYSGPAKVFAQVKKGATNGTYSIIATTE